MRNIIIVDADVSVVRQIVKALVCDPDSSVFCEYSETDAQSLLRHTRPDVFICSTRMGRRLFTHARRKNPNVRLIALTDIGRMPFNRRVHCMFALNPLSPSAVAESCAN